MTDHPTLRHCTDLRVSAFPIWVILFINPAAKAAGDFAQIVNGREG